MVEYLGNCPNCNKHTIVNATTAKNGTVKPSQTNTHRPTKSSTPKSKVAKCLRCGLIGRITIIGTVGGLASATDQPILDENLQVDPQLNSYSLRLNIAKR